MIADRAAGGSKFARYLLPAIIFQSVLIGGGYATGREIVEFGARFGSLGVWSIVAVFVGFTVMSILTYEFARVTRSYNHRPFMRRLIGPGWPVFDVLYVVMAVLSIAVLGSAAGEIGASILGLPYLVGVGLVILLVALITFFGRGLIERMKSTGTMLVYLVYVTLAIAILSTRWDNVREVFATGNTGALDSSSFMNSPTVLAALAAGVLYVGYNLVVVVAVMFSLDRLTQRKESIWGGVLTGVLSVIPFILTYLCILSFYPGEEILGAAVPWLAMVGELGTGAGVLAAFFAVVVIYTLVETSVGIIHALVGRIDDSMKEAGRGGLTGGQSAIFGGVVLLGAMLLSQVGIFNLVASGYTYMAYAFLILFALPLATIGVYKIATIGKQEARQPEE